MTGSKRPLLVVDGDSLAHRAYHGLPKTIRRAGRQAGRRARPASATSCTGLWEQERPRAVVVGWDTLEVPTYRHKALPGYQAGRVFDDALLEQLALLPALVESFGFRSARAPGYEADDFLAAAAKTEEKRGGTALVVTSDRDAFQLATAKTSIVRPVRGVSVLERVGTGRGACHLRRRARAGARLHRAARRPLGQDPRCEGRRAEDSGARPRGARHARGGPRRRKVRSAGGGLAPLPSNSDARRLRPPPLPERPDTNLGGGVGSLTRARHERSREPARTGGRRDRSAWSSSATPSWRRCTRRATIPRHRRASSVLQEAFPAVA